MTTTPQTYTARLSPSGPLIGNPPGLVGGGAAVPGRTWIAEGSGAPANVPGTAVGSINGLDAVPVDIRPGTSGYRYDIEVDTVTFGTGGNFVINVAASTDGVTYAVIYTPQGTLLNSGEGRLHLTNYSNPNAAPITKLKVLLQRGVAAGADLTYDPGESSLRVREWSTS